MLHRLVDGGQSVVVIEHHLDVIAEADRIIDLGPDDGLKGAWVMGVSTPEVMVRSAANHTRPVLMRGRRVGLSVGSRPL